MANIVAYFHCWLQQNHVKNAVGSKFKEHLWYLSETLVALAFFDGNVNIGTKQAVVNTMDKPPIGEAPCLKASIDVCQVAIAKLDQFASSPTQHFIEILGLVYSNFLNHG